MLLSFTLRSGITAQELKRFNTFSYNVNEGLLQSSMNDMAFDKNNFCWISFPNGIQKFDGKNFTNVPIQKGLPDDKWVQFFKASNGDLFISHAQGISKYEINNNRFVQFYTNPPGDKSVSQFIGEDEGIIYFYTSHATITGFELKTLKIIPETKTGFPAYSNTIESKPRISSNIAGHKTAFHIHSVFYLWDLKQGKLLSQSEPIPYSSGNLMTLKTASELLFYSFDSTNNLELYNFSSGKRTMLFKTIKENKFVGRCIIYQWQNKTLLSVHNRLYETDADLKVFKTEMVNFQNRAMSDVSSIARIREDNFGNLYLSTINDGIRKIIRNSYPVKYFGTGKKEENVISILPDKKNNRLLVGTAGSGLLIFDTLQHLVKHIKTLPVKTLPFYPNCIVKDNNGDYNLFLWSEKKAWKLSKDLTELKSTAIRSSLPVEKQGIGYFGNFLFQNKEVAVTQAQGRIYKTNFTSNTIAETELSREAILSGLLYKNQLVIHSNDELVFFDTAAFREVRKIPFKNTGDVRCFATDGKYIYVGCNKGIFKTDEDGKIFFHLTRASGLPDECIYSIRIDNEGFLWCSTNKGIFKINKDNSIFQLRKEDGLQENEFNTNVAAKTADGELFFGGVNGVTSFYPNTISSFEEKLNILFTKIKINNEEAFTDTAAWNIKDMDLPHDKNSLSFDFIAMANNNPDQYIYQYRMDGIDKEWLQNNDLQTVRYFLPPGDYVFKVYASRFFDKNAKALQQIRITIHPPFWKTWWFTTIATVLFLMLLVYFINGYSKRRYKKRLMELETEHKMQLERERISRDLHDSIGAYANAVLYNTELLEKEQQYVLRNELMQDLKFASKDIITSLRETIWALKKDNYSSHDCLMRIRNFVQPFNRYYPHIHFSVEGEASAENILHYTKALNVVRIVQEAVTNAIKHSAAKNITVKSSGQQNSWHLEVTDDGKGFYEEKTEGTDIGNGLQNMKQRAAEASFELSIVSQPGKGTAVIIIV